MREVLTLTCIPSSLPERAPQNVETMAKGQTLGAELGKGGELEFLHDVTVPITCQTCRPWQPPFVRQPTATTPQACARNPPDCAPLLIPMSRGSGVKRLKACLRRPAVLTPWAVVSTSPVASSPNETENAAKVAESSLVSRVMAKWNAARSRSGHRLLS